MARITWDAVGSRFYETGVDHGVLYTHTNEKRYGEAEAWNGLISVAQSPSGAEPTPLYADNIKYISLTSAEEFAATIEAYTYPDNFGKCDGSFSVPVTEGLSSPFSGINIGQQEREEFGFAYRTIKGNDEKYNNLGYIHHLVYGAKAAPSERSHSTVNDSPEAITFSWSVSTTAVPVNSIPNVRPTSLIEIDSTKVPAAFLTELETLLYGTETISGYLPLPDEIIALYQSTTAGV